MFGGWECRKSFLWKHLFQNSCLGFFLQWPAACQAPARSLHFTVYGKKNASTKVSDSVSLNFLYCDLVMHFNAWQTWTCQAFSGALCSSALWDWVAEMLLLMTVSKQESITDVAIAATSVEIIIPILLVFLWNLFDLSWSICDHNKRIYFSRFLPNTQ